MLTIREFIASDIEQSVAIFHKLSLFYLGDNTSDLETFRSNLLNNILGKSSSIKLFLAFKQSQAVALATVAMAKWASPYNLLKNSLLTLIIRVWA